MHSTNLISPRTLNFGAKYIIQPYQKLDLGRFRNRSKHFYEVTKRERKPSRRELENSNF